MGVVYVLACLGAELVSESTTLKNHPEVGPIIEERFSTIPIIIMTLLQFATEDSLNVLYFPIITASPHLSLYFLLCFIVVSVLLMNLISAIVIEAALQRAHLDREARMHSMRKKLRKYKPWINKCFDALDKTGDGSLQLAEVANDIIKMKRDLVDELP